MLLILEGMPQEDELVLCTITSVQSHSVFVTMDEYAGKTAMIHISEVAAGRIRNIRDFVEEGKKVVCKVLKINREKGHVDLSLRRVNESQKRQKNNEIKKEQLAEKIIEKLSRETKKDFKKTYYEIYNQIKHTHSRLYPAFEELQQGTLKTEKLGIEKKLGEQLLGIIQQTIKPEQIIIEAEFKLKTYDPKGVDIVKDILQKLQQKDTEISYKGGGTYRAILTGEDYKKTEKKLSPLIEKLEKLTKQNKMEFDFKRIAKQ